MELYQKLLKPTHKSEFLSDPRARTIWMSHYGFYKIKFWYWSIFIHSWYAIGVDPAQKENVKFELMDIINPIALRAMELQIFLREELGLKEDDVVNQRILKKQKELY